jgi:hypothetical protein
MIQTVTTYDELRKYCAAFAAGHFEVFILLGNPGLAKSTLLRKELESRENKWLEGTVSAFRLYCEAYWNRNKPIVIDDVDTLYGDWAAIRVLKCLCRPIRSSSSAGTRQPSSWTSRVCLGTSTRSPRSASSQTCGRN